MQGMEALGGNTQSISELQLEDIDFQWVRKEKNIKQLRKALRLIELDGDVFKDLKKACEDRIVQIDPKALKKFNNDVDTETQNQILDDIFQWQNEVEQKEYEIQATKESNIFEDTNYSAQESPELSLAKLEELAEKQKLQGNEAIKSKDFNEALQYYTQSINYNPRLTASYYNRALVYIKLQQYQKAVQDCTLAIQIQPNYSKAYNRRGRAYYHQEQLELARADYLKALEYDPNNSDANGDLKEVEDLMKKRGIKASGGGGFKKVQIIQQDDDEDNQDGEESEIKKPQQNSEDQNQENEEIQQRRRKEHTNQTEEIEKIKKEANDQIKDGLYPDAIKLLEDCIQKEDNLGSFSEDPADVQQFRQRKANYYNNLALIYQQLDENQKTIEYANKVIDFEDDLDRDPVIKAYLRRAMAFEKLEKLLPAQQDFDRVKELDPSNLQASKGLSRILPQIDPETLAKANREVSQKVKLKEQKQESDKRQKEEELEEQKKQIEEKKIKDAELKLNKQQSAANTATEVEQQQVLPTDSASVPNNSINKPLLLDIQAIKDEGNKEFKENKISNAVKIFKTGIRDLQKFYNPQIKNSNTPQSVLYLQLLTNCALGHLKLSLFTDALTQCSKALEIDNQYLKALYRRALARKGIAQQIKDLSRYEQVVQKQELVEKGIEDLKNLKIYDQGNTTADQELKQLISLQTTLLLQLQDRESKENGGTNNPKPNDNNPAPSKLEEEKKEAPSKKPLQNNFMGINEKELQKVTNDATLNIIDSLIAGTEVPSTAGALEQNINNFKQNSDKLLAYLKRLPSNCIEELYKNQELPHDKLLLMLDSIQAVGIETDAEYSFILLGNLTQCSKFEMTAMCLSQKEQQRVQSIIDRLTPGEESKREEIYKKYQIS